MVLYVVLIHHSSGLPMAAEVVSWAVVSWSAGGFCVCAVSARGCCVALFVVELSCKENYIKDNENDELISIFSVFSDRILIIWSSIRNGNFSRMSVNYSVVLYCDVEHTFILQYQQQQLHSYRVISVQEQKAFVV